MVSKNVISTREIGIIEKELHGQFIEFLGSCIYDGIWVGENTDIPNVNGIRKSVADALNELEPPLLRWPGGCYADTYHWRDGIGDRKKRPVTYNENFGTYEPDTNQFGLHEFMEVCQMTGAKPWINVNRMTGSPQEMREWMEYCNRKEGTDLSKEREENGSRESFDVSYWGIGNEVWGGGGTMTASDYANDYRRFSSSVPTFASANGPSEVPMRLIACGPDGNKPKERVRWTKDFFQALAEYRMPPLYGYDLHFYNWNMKEGQTSESEFSKQEWYDVIHGCLELENVIKEQHELMQEGLKRIPKPEGFFPYPDKGCRLILGEWGNWHRPAFYNRPALFQQSTMRDAVTTAISLDILHRNCNKVAAACVAQTVNVLNSLLITEKEKCIRTPNYDVFMLYKVHRGAMAVEIKNMELPDEVFLFASVKDSILSVNLINANYETAQSVFMATEIQSCFIKVESLYSEHPQDCNTWDDPDRVRIRSGKKPVLENEGYRIELLPASVNVYQFELLVRKTVIGG